MKEFLSDIKEYGVKVAAYNLKFNFCFWLLDAQKMKVRKKYNVVKVKSKGDKLGK